MLKDLKAYFDDIDPYNLFIGTIFPAPIPNAPIQDYSDFSLENIVARLSEDELWRIANSFLKRKELDQAEKYLALSIKKNPKNYKIIATRGLTKLLQGDLKKASYYLQRALTKNHQLPEARIWLAFVRLKEGKLKGAIFQIDKIETDVVKSLKAIISVVRVLSTMTAVNTELLDTEMQNLNAYAENPFVRGLLTIFGFLKGRIELEQGNLSEAARIWAHTFNQDQEGWFSHQMVQSYLHSLGKKRLHFLSVILHQNKDYQQVLEKLLHLCLLPEFFEEEMELHSRLDFWKDKLSSKGSYPYAHFRYSLCLLYLGENEKAYENFLVCRDKIPTSKVSFFKIDELIDWARESTHGMLS